VLCEVAVENLNRVDGRASGIKFNKLLYYLHKKLSAATNPSMRVDVPYRWYLYGAAAVIESPLLFGTVRVDHPEDEARSNIELVHDFQRAHAREPEGLRQESTALARPWAEKYRGEEGVPSMLRDHYLDAPNGPGDFQRAYLEWSLLTRSILTFQRADSLSETTSAFEIMVRTFPAHLEPRLTPAFSQLTMFLEPRVAERKLHDRRALEVDVQAMREFWQTFCLFLSKAFHHHVERESLAYWSGRAESELVIYKRKLAAFLEQGYLAEASATERGASDFSEVAGILASDARDALNGA
jgi:hypothetical protein